MAAFGKKQFDKCFAPIGLYF